MRVVIGTAGHIDHGKTSLLRALTGIDADRLPEERRRGMTIDIGYAHMTLDDGSELDFVDVPGHDRLVGNMLVGAGEIDAVMLVVAADDGVRAQTREHLALIDALGVSPGLAVVTKVDAVADDRGREVIDAVARLLQGTSLAGSPVLAASSVSGVGLADIRAALTDVSDRVRARAIALEPRLAVDRVFRVKGRGVVVTGTLRGGSIGRGMTLRVVPGDRSARVREVQVHGHEVEAATPGRTALNLAGLDIAELRRGTILTDDPLVAGTSRMLVRLQRPLPDRTRARVHIGTAAVDAAVGRSGRDLIDLPIGTAAGILRLSEPVGAAPGDRFVLRRPGAVDPIVGGVVLDPRPPRGVSRQRQTPVRVEALARAVDASDRVSYDAARLDLHGLVEGGRRPALATDVEGSARDAALGEVGSAPAPTLIALRTIVARTIRRGATSTPERAAAAAVAVIDDLVATGALVRDGPNVHAPGQVATEHRDDPESESALGRLERALAVMSPPPLAEAALAAGCPPSGIRDLERAGRIVVLEPDLAYAATTYRDLETRALELAHTTPLTPATLRDATGTSRKYVMAILEDLDRRGVLRRTADGHVPGPRAPSRASRT